MGFPQFPSWVSNFVKNLPRSLPADAPPSVANIVAQDMTRTEPAAFVETYDPCKALPLADLAQMPMHITDPQQRKQWCQDCLDRKRNEAMPQPNLRAFYPRLGNTPRKTDTPAGNVKPPLKLLSASDALGKNTSDNLTNLNLVTGGSGFDERHLAGTSLEDQARQNRENFYQSFNRLNSGGGNDAIDTPPGGGFPGFSSQVNMVILSPYLHWEQQDGDRSYFTPGDPIGWNDDAPQFQLGTAVFDFEFPSVPGTPPDFSKPDEPKEMTEEEKEAARQAAVLVARALFWPLDVIMSADEYERDNSLGNLINLGLSLLPVIGLIGDIVGKAGSLLRKIPGVDTVIGKLGEAVINVWDNTYFKIYLSGLVANEADLTKKIELVEDAIKGIQRREVAYGFSSTGELIYSEIGPLGGATVVTPLDPRMKGGISIHNHPSGGSFSPEDIWATIKNDEEMTIVVGTTSHANAEQWKYTISRPEGENGWGGLDIYREEGKLQGKLFQDYEIAYTDAELQFYNKRKIGGPNFIEQEAGAITDINAYATHHAMQEIAKKWGFKYERIPLNNAARTSKGYDSFFP